jgi:hypothetical protein
VRSALAKPTRDLFFAGLREAAPDFVRTSTHDIKGFTWSFLRRRGALRQWLWFQRHKHQDAFTVELSWSLLSDEPAAPGFGGPDDAFRPAGYRFRLGAFFAPHGDHWWHVADPAPAAANVQQLLESLAASQRVDVAAAMPRIEAAVADALGHLRAHALPYFDRVSEWAGHADRLGTDEGVAP